MPVKKYVLLTIGDGLVAQIPIAFTVDFSRNNGNPGKQFRGHGQPSNGADV